MNTLELKDGMIEMIASVNDKKVLRHLYEVISQILSHTWPEDYELTPGQEPDALKEESVVNYGENRFLNLDQLDNSSRKLILDFFKILLESQTVEPTPDDPFGNKAWKKRIRKEVSVWSEDHVNEWRENLRKMDNWNIPQW